VPPVTCAATNEVSAATSKSAATTEPAWTAGSKRHPPENEVRRGDIEVSAATKEPA
jgi:hypothetical protein